MLVLFTRKLGADRLRIDATHQFADVLFLSPERTAFLHALGVQNGVEQILVEVHGLQIRFLQGDEFLPEFLACKVLAFSRAFAGLCFVHRLKYSRGRPPIRGRESTMGTVAKRESLGRAELENLVTLALDEASRLGVDQAEAAASQDTGLSATARLGEVESLEYTNDRGIGITVFKDSRKGNASTSDVSPEAIREAVAKAVSFASVTAQDKYAGLADPDLMCKDVVDLDLDHPWELDADAAIELAVATEKAGRDHDARVSNSEGATVYTNRGSRAYGNSHGFAGSYSKTSHSITCVLLAEEDGVMQRDYHYTSARCADDMESGADVGRKASEKTVGRLGARKIKTTRAPVVFIPELARGFIGHAIGAIAGGAQYRRSSFLLDAAGEELFPDFVSIQERPHLPRAMASVSYDSEGVATYDRDIVADGVLQGYVLSSYSARRLGLATTANAGGAQNLIVPGGGKDKDALIGEMGTGLVVMELLGQGVNGVTGDYWLSWRAGQLLSVGFSLGTLALVWSLLARLGAADRGARVCALAVLVFLPREIYNAVFVSNDSMAIFAVTSPDLASYQPALALPQKLVQIASCRTALPSRRGPMRAV